MSGNGGHFSELALAKAKIVAPLRGLKVIPSEQMLAACREAGKLLGIKEGEVSHQTIRNWLRILEKEGVAGLDRKRHKNRGSTTVPPELERIIKGILLSPKRFSMAEVHRRIEKYASRHLKLSPGQIPSLKQIMYIWQHISLEEKILALEGIHAYRRKFDQYVRFQALYANAIWQADHHLLDIIVIDPETKEELGRPWITIIQDDHTRAIVGYYLSLDPPSSISIAFALYHAFLQKPQEWWIMHGIPKVLYVDRGKDWISKHIEAVCLDFGIELRPHEAYHPQSKGKIEREGKSLEQICIHPLDGSVGSNTRVRPNRVTPKHPIDRVRVEVEYEFKQYHERKHGTTGERPIDDWSNDAAIIRPVTDLTIIDRLLKSKSYTVHRDGIHFQYKQYRDPEQILAGYIGRKVTVFFNPRNTSRIRVWANDENGNAERFLCTAYPQEISEIPADRDDIRESNKRRRDLVRQRVRTAQEEGKKVLKQLEIDHVEHLTEFEQSNIQPASTSTDPLPADGLLETKRTEPQPASEYRAVTSGDTDMDALRRQLIRAKRSQ